MNIFVFFQILKFSHNFKVCQFLTSFIPKYFQSLWILWLLFQCFSCPSHSYFKLFSLMFTSVHFFPLYSDICQERMDFFLRNGKTLNILQVMEKNFISIVLHGRSHVGILFMLSFHLPVFSFSLLRKDSMAGSSRRASTLMWRSVG